MWDLRVELVKSNLNRVEEIELDLVGKSEPMEIFVLMLVKIDCNGFQREENSGKDVVVVVQARETEGLILQN